MSTAPPGTGPPPSLNDAPDAQASDTSQTNGNKISFVLLFIYLFPLHKL